MIANMSRLEQKAGYPLIPLEGNIMTSRAARTLGTVTTGDLHLPRSSDEFVLQSLHSPLLRNHLLQKSEIRLKSYSASVIMCNSNILFFLESDFSILLYRACSI